MKGSARMNNITLTLLTLKQADRTDGLQVLRKAGPAFHTDLSILNSVYRVRENYYTNAFEDEPFDYFSSFFTKTEDGDLDVYCYDEIQSTAVYRWATDRGIRPVINDPILYDALVQKRKPGRNGTYEVEFGVYPQYFASIETGNELEMRYECNDLITTDKKYTIMHPTGSGEMHPVALEEYPEYEYQNDYYIRYTAFDESAVFASNGQAVLRDNDYWIKVSPVLWLLDEETKLLISKRSLVSGVRFNSKPYSGDFETTEVKQFIDTYLTPNLFDKSEPKDRVLKQNESLKQFIYRKNI